MARGTTLQELVRMVREETGQSTNAALGQNQVDALKQRIRRTQEVLWLEHYWPHMRVQRDITTQAGMRYYTPPSDLSLNHRIDTVSVFHNNQWIPVESHISLAHYNQVNPDANERRDPVQRWQLHEGEQIELWPMPATDGVLVRISGTRNLRPLIADDDIADLDDQLIVLFMAAEVSARQKQEDAGAKLRIAQQHLTRLKGENSKLRRFTTGGRMIRDVQYPEGDCFEDPACRTS